MRFAEGFVEADGLDHGSGHCPQPTRFAFGHPGTRRHTWPMARVAVVFTGGTISMRHDAGAGGNLPAMRGDELLASVPGLADIAEIEPIDWGLVPASHLSFEQVLEIGRLVADRLAQPEIDGVVVVQGTDVIEETAFAWDLLPLPAKPIVVVGAMRSASQEAYDGPENLRNAVAAAADPLMAEQGVVVAMAGELHGADDVRKTHTHAHAAFQSPNAGRVGLVADGRVTLLRRRSPVRLAPHPGTSGAARADPGRCPGRATGAHRCRAGRPGRCRGGRWKHAAGLPRARTTAHRCVARRWCSPRAARPAARCRATRSPAAAPNGGRPAPSSPARSTP